MIKIKILILIYSFDGTFLTEVDFLKKKKILMKYII
jgi:hypothetical protein